MAGELVVMSARELDRLAVIKQVLERRLTRVKAGEIMQLTPRQVARLCAAYERDGAAGLASRKRGRVGNRKLATETETRVIELVRSYYEDFGPTLAREKLLERHDLVKELRLRDLSGMEAGNAFLPEFMTDFNAKFGRPPRNQHDAHRPLRPGEDLDRIFSERTERSLSAQLMVRDDNHLYKVQRVSCSRPSRVPAPPLGAPDQRTAAEPACYCQVQPGCMLQAASVADWSHTRAVPVQPSPWYVQPAAVHSGSAA